ncbi:hypothetical protein HGI30_09190 [Paenibacillus albicereus]|uniref:Uncharacterized protein n=1 Tax=Paenibacillus albicereus TaxID=2726185 RepID=A0A6H2GWA0_9BACL|nr:hypothetical protein [Paenibacillus albicereus]QJC51701.1 hypothetical protein HGI30_09190 [Paenibacillus albicereus]
MALHSLRPLMAALLALTLAALPAAVSAASPLAPAASSETSPQLAASEADAGAFRSALETKASRWRDELSRLPEFAAWKSAELRLEPLGPGTHAWLVDVRQANGGRPVGYMILNAKDDGTVELGEYGAGESPLFRPSALRRGLEKEGLRPADFTALMQYASPFAAVWRLEDRQGRIRFADATSGELLPIQEKDWNQAAKRTSSSAIYNENASVTKPNKPASLAKPVRLTSSRSFRGDDPLQRLAWLLQAPLAAPSEAKLLQRLQAGTPLDYTAEVFGGKALYIGQAAGFHRWSEAPAFGAFRMAGSTALRYVPLVDAAAAGFFYPVAAPGSQA